MDFSNPDKLFIIPFNFSNHSSRAPPGPALKRDGVPLGPHGQGLHRRGLERREGADPELGAHDGPRAAEVHRVAEGWKQVNLSGVN